MQPLTTIAAQVLAETIRRQPASKERTAFAWTVAVGPAMSRASTVELRGRTLVVHPRDAGWAREIGRATATILPRLAALLGPGAVDRIDIELS
jgi:hypothetical protein